MTVPVLRDAGLSALLPNDPELQNLASGFEFTEGPLEVADGAILFQDIKAERTYRIGLGEAPSVLREKTGAANGQTFDADERVVFCEQNGRRVSRMRPDGTEVEVLVEEFEGKRLNSPNDIVSRSDGTLYFTDPPYGAPPDRPLAFQGVFTLDRSRQLTLLADDFEKPNGLAFSPDERTLYVCDTARYHVRAFSVLPSGQFAPGSERVFATMDPEGQGGPDGMKVDQQGRLYVAVAQGIWVYSDSGDLLGILGLPKRPSNLAWCGADNDHLVITMVDEVIKVRLLTNGCAPPFRPRRS